MDGASEYSLDSSTGNDSSTAASRLKSKQIPSFWICLEAFQVGQMVSWIVIMYFIHHILKRGYYLSANVLVGELHATQDTKIDAQDPSQRAQHATSNHLLLYPRGSFDNRIIG